MKNKELKQFLFPVKTRKQQNTLNNCFQTLDIDNSGQQSLKKGQQTRQAQILYVPPYCLKSVSGPSTKRGNPKEPSGLTQLRKQRRLEHMRQDLRKEKTVQRGQAPREVLDDC